MEKRQQHPWGTPPPLPYGEGHRVLLSLMAMSSPLHRKNKRLFHTSSQGQPSRHISRTSAHLRSMSANRTVHVRHPRPAYGPADSRSPPYAPYSALALSSAFKYHTPISPFSTYPIPTLQTTMSGLKITEFSVHGMSCAVLLLTTG